MLLVIHPPKGQFRPTRFCYALGLATVLAPLLCVIYARFSPVLGRAELMPATMALLLTLNALALQLTGLNLLYCACPPRLFTHRRSLSYVLLTTTVLTFVFGFSSLAFICIR